MTNSGSCPREKTESAACNKEITLSEQDRDLNTWADEQLRASGYRKPILPDWLKYFLTVTVPIGLVIGLLRLIGIAADR